MDKIAQLQEMIDQSTDRPAGQIFQIFEAQTVSIVFR